MNSSQSSTMLKHSIQSLSNGNIILSPQSGTNLSGPRGKSATRPAVLSASVSLRSIIRGALVRWKLNCFLALIIGLGVGAAVWFGQTTKFQAMAQLRVSVSEPSILPKQTSFSIADGEMFQRTQLALLRGRGNIDSAVKDEKVKALNLSARFTDPTAWIESELRAYFVDGSELLTVSLSSTIQDEPAVIINALLEAYLLSVKTNNQDKNKIRNEELANAITKQEDRLKGKRKVVESLQDVAKTSDPANLNTRQKIELGLYEDLSKNLVRLEFDLGQKQTKLELLTSRANNDQKNPVPDEYVQLEIDAMPSVMAKQRDLDILRAKLASYQDNARGSARTLQIEQEVNQAENLLKAFRETLKATASEQLRKRAGVTTKSEIEHLKLEIELDTKQIDAMKTRIADYEDKANGFGKRSIELEQKKKDLEYEESILQSIRMERARLQVEIDSATESRVRVTAYAEKPPGPIVKNKLIPAGLAGAAAMGFVLIMIGFLEVRRKRIYRGEDIESGLGIRVLGRVPFTRGLNRLGAGIRPGSKAASDFHRYLESIDEVRTMILRHPKLGAAGHHSLLITSAERGEGKSSFATYLAISLARSGRTTLLIDGDLRSPVLHQKFGLAQQPGLCELLLEANSINEVIVQTIFPNLALVPAGAPEAKVLEKVTHASFRQIIDMFHQYFDYVIIDGSPILQMVDSLLYAQHLDSTILVARSQMSQLQKVYDASEKIGQTGASVLGMVVTGEQTELLTDYDYSSCEKLRPLGN